MKNMHLMPFVLCEHENQKGNKTKARSGFCPWSLPYTFLLSKAYSNACSKLQKHGDAFTKAVRHAYRGNTNTVKLPILFHTNTPSNLEDQTQKDIFLMSITNYPTILILIPFQNSTHL